VCAHHGPATKGQGQGLRVRPGTPKKNPDTSVLVKNGSEWIKLGPKTGMFSKTWTGQFHQFSSRFLTEMIVPAAVPVKRKMETLPCGHRVVLAFRLAVVGNLDSGGGSAGGGGGGGDGYGGGAEGGLLPPISQ
jgi:hypothetical protein